MVNLLLGISLGIPVAAMPSKEKAPVQASIERVGGMNHFEFSGRKEWDYSLKKEGVSLSLVIPKMDEKSQEVMESFSSLLIKSISLNHDVPNKTKVIINLNHEKVDSFDYLTQNPDQLIIDLFVDNDKILTEIRNKKKADDIAKNEASKKNKKTKSPKNPDRRPAFAEFFVTNKEVIEDKRKKDTRVLPLVNTTPMNELFDFGGVNSQGFNQEDLEAKVIEAQGNIYLRFPILKLTNRHLQELQSFQPEYEIRKSFSDENKMARDLLNLFNSRSFASFIKAKKVFKSNFPQSSYDEILNYVEADTWVELWKMNKRPEYLTKAMDIYKMMIERYPNSKIAERTLIQAGLLAHDSGEFFVATKMLRRYLKNYPYSPFNNHIKIYLGDSLAHLNNYDGARNAMEQVVKANERDTSAEAKYRIGDIYFLKQSFRRAERAYKQAQEKFPRYAKQYPNAVFNRAEALFNLAEYPSSLEIYKEFFEKFPTHPYSAYALTRIGELIDLLKDDRHKAQGFYNESFFRFRNTMGGTIARMRSLSQRFKDMKSQELKTSIEEIRKREKAIDLHQVDEFSAFMISDGYYDRGDYLEAANTLINYFQINPKPVNIKKFEKRISRAIAGEVKQLLHKGDVVSALNIIESHQKSWLSKSRRVDVQLFRAQAYEKMKLLDEALESYERIEKRMKGLFGTKEEKERKVFEYYPSFDQINLRQAVVQYELGKKKKALSLLKEVKEISSLDTQSKIDFHFTLARIAFDSKNYDEAMKTGLLVDSSEIVMPEQREKFNIFLSRVYEENQKYDKAISILEKFYEKYKDEQDQVYTLSRLFSLYRSKGMKDKAMTTGRSLIEEYSKSHNLDKERYYLGALYFEAKNPKEAKKVWKGLTKKSMWEELARNKQISDDWQDETEKKINRIPAMAK